MEVFGITGSISQKQPSSDVIEGDPARAEMSSACDVRVGSTFQNENATAPPSPKRMRLDTDRMEQPAADMPLYTNNCKMPLSEAEKEILGLLAQSTSLPHYILQEGDTAKKQVELKDEQTETVEFPEESIVHNQEFDSHPLCPVNVKKTEESDVACEIRRSPGLLHGVEHAVESHLIPVTFDSMDASAFEKHAVGTYSSSRYRSVTVESSVSASDDFQQEFYGNACGEQGTEEYHILTASHLVSDSSLSNPGRNPYGTPSGYMDAVGSQDRASLCRESTLASDGETKGDANEERVVCDEEMADYASPGSIFTYDVSLSGDLGSNEPEINASLALCVPGKAPLWLSNGAAQDAEGLHKCDEYTAVVAHSGLSHMAASVYNDVAAVTDMDAGHEVNGADEQTHIIPEHRRPEVNSLKSDSTCVTVSPRASGVSLNDTDQCRSFPEVAMESPIVRSVVFELSDDQCAFVSPSNCDVENLNVARIPRSLTKDDEQLVMDDVGLDALLPTSNGFSGERPTTEDAVSISPQGTAAFGRFTKDPGGFDTCAEAVADAYTAGPTTDLLVLASLVSDSPDHHESRLEAAACPSPDRLMALRVEEDFFDSSPSPSEMGLRLLSEGLEEKSKELQRGAAGQQLESLPAEERAKVTDAFAHSGTSHGYTVKDMSPFTLCCFDAVVPLSHVTPTEEVTKERPVQHVFSECVPLGFDSGFEKVQISPDSDLENSPLLDSSSMALAAAAVTHAHTPTTPPDNDPATLTHSGIHSDEASELISHCKDNCSAYLLGLGARWEGEESHRSSSASVVSPQLSLSPFEPEENICPSDGITGNAVPLFEMKEMFDLVIEELHLYFEIDREEEKEESDELSPVSRRGISALQSSSFSKSQEVFVSSDNIVEAKQEEVESSDGQNHHKVLDCEQEVPLESGHSLPEVEDSMYSTTNSKELRKMDNYMPWSPAFLSVPFLEHLGKVEAPPKRLEPLKTCSRPIRVGLSKKARTKQLHPNLK